MDIKFLLLITVAIIGVKGQVVDDSGQEPPFEQSKFEVDAARWAELYKKYMTLTPYVTLRGYFRVRCRLIQECCPNQRDNLYDILRELKIEKVCVGAQGTKLYNSHSAKCRNLIQDYINMGKSTGYAESLRIETNQGMNSRRKSWRAQMGKVCSKAELTSFYCDPENMVPFQSCVEKVLRLVDRENSESGYDDFVRQLKSDYATYIRKYESASF